MSVGENIKQTRQAKGLTQKELGEKLGIKQATISMFEKDKTNIKISTLRKIARALDVDIRILTKGNESSITEEHTTTLNTLILDVTKQELITEIINQVSYYIDKSDFKILDADMEKWIDADSTDDILRTHILIIENNENNKKYGLTAREVNELYFKTLDYFKYLLTSLIKQK